MHVIATTVYWNLVCLLRKNAKYCWWCDNAPHHSKSGWSIVHLVKVPMHLVVLKPRAKTWKLRSLCIVAGGSGGQLGETSCGKQSSCLGLESGKVFCDRMSSKSLREITLILHFATPALKLVYSWSILRTVHMWKGYGMEHIYIYVYIYISSNLAIHRHGSTKRALLHHGVHITASLIKQCRNSRQWNKFIQIPLVRALRILGTFHFFGFLHTRSTATLASAEKHLAHFPHDPCYLHHLQST